MTAVASHLFPYAVSETDSHSVIEQQDSVGSRHPSAVVHVGESRLIISDEERETALELSELREIFYESEGQHELAEFHRQLQRQLIAGRKGERE